MTDYKNNSYITIQLYLQGGSKIENLLNNVKNKSLFVFSLTYECLPGTAEESVYFLGQSGQMSRSN